MKGITHLAAYSAIGTNYLKSNSLFVDDIRLIGDWVRDEWRESENDSLQRQNERDIEFLLDSGVARKIDWWDIECLPVMGPTDSKIPRGLVSAVLRRLEGPKAVEVLSRTLPKVDPIELREMIYYLSSRAFADMLCEHDIDATSLHYHASSSPDAHATQANALRIVVNQVPVPTLDIPWQDIAALRSEAEFQHRVRLLRQWIASIAASPLSSGQLEDAVKTSLYEYESYMKAVGAKYRYSGFSWLVATGAQILDDLLHLRIGKLASGLIEVGKERVEYQLSEQSAPGRELPIVAQVRRRFDE